MTSNQQTNTTLRTADLTPSSRHAFRIDPESSARNTLAEELGITSIKKLRFEGVVEPSGKNDWKLTGQLGATVVQPCIVSLEPVTTRIDEQVDRLYLANAPDDPDGEEIEIPEDDTIEPLPATIDFADLMAEALALALPQYPKVEGAEVESTTFTEPGATAMSDDDAKPFAGLAGLKAKLEGGDS